METATQNRTETATGQAVDAESIPAEMRARHQWVAWGFRNRIKIPINPRTGGNACSNVAATWSTFERAFDCYESKQLSGVGFMFSAEDPFFGVDLDACRNPSSGQLTPWASAIVDRLDTYCEVSPSGYGVKLVGRGGLPAGSKHGKKLRDVPTFGDKAPEIAVYDRLRFWCMTGRRLPGSPLVCEERQPQLDELRAEWFGAAAPAAACASRRRPATESGSSKGLDRGAMFRWLLAECEAGRPQAEFDLCEVAQLAGWESDFVWGRAQQVGRFVAGGREYFDQVWAKAASYVASSQGASRRRRFKDAVAKCSMLPKGTRSENDFHLCCEAVRQSLAMEDVWQQVSDVGKFAGDRRYFERTWLRAEETVRRGPA